MAVNDAQPLEEVEREQREGADDLQRPLDLFDVTEVLLQLVDDVGAALDLNLQVAVDGAAAFQSLRCFDVVHQGAQADLRTRPFKQTISKSSVTNYTGSNHSLLPIVC